MIRSLGYGLFALCILTLQACSTSLMTGNRHRLLDQASASKATKKIDGNSASIPNTSLQDLWNPYFPGITNKWFQQVMSDHVDIHIAASRIREIEALTAIASASLFPSVQLTGTANRGNDRIGAPRVIDLQKIGLNIDWDLDLAGAKRSTKQANQLRLAANRIALDQARLELAAALATALIDMATANTQFMQLKQRWEVQQTSIEWLDGLVRAGLQDQSQREQALALQTNIAAKMSAAETSLANAQLRIERLLGHAPGTLHHAWPEVLPLLKLEELYLGFNTIMLQTLTSQLREQPMLRMQRLEWQAQQADLRSAEAALWPNLSLASFFGAQHLSGPVMVAANPIYALGATLSMTALDFGRLKAAARAADARAEQAALRYESLVLQTLENISRDLNDAKQAEQATDLSVRAVTHQRNAAELSNVRFQHGLASGLSANLGLANAIDAELNLIEQQRARNLASLRCLVSLGIYPLSENTVHE